MHFDEIGITPGQVSAWLASAAIICAARHWAKLQRSLYWQGVKDLFREICRDLNLSDEWRDQQIARYEQINHLNP